VKVQCRSVSRILSVPPRWDGRGSHFSGPGIAPRLKRPTREWRSVRRQHGTLRRAASPLIFGLAPDGVCRAPAIADGAVSSYLAFSPLPRRIPCRTCMPRPKGLRLRSVQRCWRRCVFCDTVRSPLLAHTGPPALHGASCSAEFGLSSSRSRLRRNWNAAARPAVLFFR